MKLFTKQIDKELFAQYAKGNDLANQKVVAKIFNPYGKGEWFILNSDPADPDYLWAIVKINEVEIGSVSRSELENIKVPPFKLGLERDMYFDPKNALEVYNGLLNGKHYADGGLVEPLIGEMSGDPRFDINSPMFADGGEVKKKDDELLKYVYPKVKELFHKNGLTLKDNYSFTDGSQKSYLPYFSYQRTGDKLDKVYITYYGQGFEVIGEVKIEVEDEVEIEIEFQDWSIKEKAKYADGGLVEPLIGEMSGDPRFDINSPMFAKGGEVEIVGDYKDDKKNYYFRRFKDAIGSFAWLYDKKYNEGILYPLSDFDEEYYSHLKLKYGEYLLRYSTDRMFEANQHLIKLNLEKMLIYFLKDSDDDKNPKFETLGTKAEYIVIEKNKFAKGGMVVGKYYKAKDGNSYRYAGDSSESGKGVFFDKNRKYSKIAYDDIQVFGDGGDLNANDSKVRKKKVDTESNEIEDGFKGSNADFFKWYIEWYRPISKRISIAFSIPNELTDSIVSKDAIVLDVFSKIDQTINAKELLKDITDKADELGISIYLLPTPIHHKLSDEHKDKITKDYLIDYYTKAGFESIGNDWMERKPKYEEGGKIESQDSILMNEQTYKIAEMIEDAGYYAVVNKSRTHFGKSNYIYIYPTQKDYDDRNSNAFKVRISDHDVSNQDRIMNEYLISLPIIDLQNTAESILAEFKFRYFRNEFFDVSKSSENQAKRLEVNEKDIKSDDKIISQRTSKSGSVIYSVERIYKNEYIDFLKKSDGKTFRRMPRFIDITPKYSSTVKMLDMYEKYKKGGITGDVDYLTDNLLTQKVKIFLEKVSPIKFYYIDEKTNKLYVGFDESFTQDAAEKFYKEAASNVEYFSPDSIDMEFFPKTGDTIYSILLKNPVKFGNGGVTFADKVKAVKKALLKRKRVAPKVQKDYGKTYSPKEALHSAKRIVGAMKKKWERKNK